MDYAQIIRRAWNVTWRNKALWVLGIFAGASGGSIGSSWRQGSESKSDQGAETWRHFTSGFARLEPYLPLIVAVAVLLFFVWVILMVLSVAARGGLVTGVNDIEDGRSPGLGELWRAGFSRFWGIVGLDLLLALPMLLLIIVLTAGVAVPVILALRSGPDALTAATILPICGVTAIGIPLMLLGGFVLGVMHQIAMRYLMLGGRGSVDSARDAWLFLRARLKDVFLLWLIGVIINAVVGAAFVFGIVLLVLPFGLGAGVAGALSAAASFVGIAVVFVLIAVALTVIFAGALGTFESAYWTIFFREVQQTLPREQESVVLDA